MDKKRYNKALNKVRKDYPKEADTLHRIMVDLRGRNAELRKESAGLRQSVEKLQGYAALPARVSDLERTVKEQANQIKQLQTDKRYLKDQLSALMTPSNLDVALSGYSGILMGILVAFEQVDPQANQLTDEQVKACFHRWERYVCSKVGSEAGKIIVNEGLCYALEMLKNNPCPEAQAHYQRLAALFQPENG